MVAQYGAEFWHGQANGDGRKLDGIGDAEATEHGLVATDDCEECWRICCECGAYVGAERRLRGPVPQLSEARNQALRGTESREDSCVTGECYLTFRVFIGLTKFSK